MTLLLARNSQKKKKIPIYLNEIRSSPTGLYDIYFEMIRSLFVL